MAQNYIFFVGGHVFGASCAPFTLHNPAAVLMMREEIEKEYPGETVSIFREVSTKEIEGFGTIEPVLAQSKTASLGQAQSPMVVSSKAKGE